MDSSDSKSSRIGALSATKQAILDRWTKAASRGAAAPAATIPRRASAGEAPLSSTQRRLWYLDQLLPGNPVNNTAFATRLRGELDRGALRRALAEIVRRHEILRT